MKYFFNLLHPFLFAIYPAVFLYSANIQEYTEISAVVPLIYSLVFGTLIFLLSKLIFKRFSQSAIVSSFIIFVSLSFGRLIGILGINNIRVLDLTVDKRIVFLIISLILLALIVFAVRRFKSSLYLVNQFLFYLSALLLIFALFPIITFEFKTKKIITTVNELSQRTVKENTRKVPDGKIYPDIYYFIFDRYAGPKSEKTKYNIDNSRFFNFLKNKGFYLAEESSANYPKTFLSLASSLNMKYLDFLTQKTSGGSSPDESITTPYIQNNSVLNYLDERGYYSVNIGPKSWNPTSQNPYVNKNFIMKSDTYPYVDAFGTGFLNMTIAEPVFKAAFANKLDISEDPNNNEHRKIALYEISAIEKAIKIPGPKFVFTHILLPHDPFVFDDKCNPIDEKEVNKYDHVYNYSKQLKCANSVMEKIINQIFENSKTLPIIVLQSDEGPFPMIDPIPPKQAWGSAKTESLKEKFPILNAYYFPDKKYDLLYPSITPVNSFRVVFNTYFGEKYPLLEDRNYVFSDEDNLYMFTDVTDRLK